MASRKLSDLHPLMQPLAAKFVAECTKEGIDVLITCTYRSGAEQNQLFEIGRTLPGKKVTNAKAGQSAHNFMLKGLPAAKAFDCVPMRAGKCVWGTSGEDGELWQQLGAIGERLGLEWAGHWKSFKEFPHFQLKGE
jgi:peptidoglycan L-alanyl-D-glutamate endopeptidase CwlK